MIGRLVPPAGTRFVEPRDSGARFDAAGSLSGRLTLAKILAYHAPPYAFSILRVFEDQLVAVACFAVRPDDIVIDYLARNALFRSTIAVRGGQDLVDALAGFAMALGRACLRLDSVSDLQSLSWYAKVGFVPEGAPFEEPGWGALQPMVRWV